MTRITTVVTMGGKLQMRAATEPEYVLTQVLPLVFLPNTLRLGRINMA
jgi:hypothetical protein